MERGKDWSQSGPSSSQSRSDDLSASPLQLNDHVYEVCRPVGRRPSVELVFFHGIQRDDRSRDPHLKTWSVRGNKGELWLAWLLQPFPDARILTVCYDAALKKTDTQGNMDVFITSENLVTCLRLAEVGQDGCPVILVGHCIGGLVVKEILRIAEFYRKDDKMQNMINSVQGIFFYATPHLGTNLSAIHQKGSLFDYLECLNKSTARLNDAFRKLRLDYGWKTAGVGEVQETHMGSFKGVIVPEASARHDLDGPLYTIAADHFDVSRPIDKSCSGFHLLSDFIDQALQKNGLSKSPNKDSSVNVVGVETNLQPILEKLAGTRRLAIVGMGGIGKSTLAKIVYEKIGKDYEYTCFVDEIKKQMQNNDTVFKLRSLITNELMRNGYKVGDTFTWETLRNKRVLLILDDADCASHVAVMTQEDQFAEQSRLITTSRDRRFLVPHGFDFHEMKMIGSRDAEMLLCRHAFGDNVVPPNIQEWVKRLAEKCGNLPLAMRVVGGHLLKRADNEDLWKDVYEKIHQVHAVTGGSNDPLQSVLELSFQTLSTHEKEVFMDIATCFHGEELKDVAPVWEALSYGKLTLQNLIDKSLVSCSNDHFRGQIFMHELHRDLGRMKANPNPDDVRTHTRVADLDKVYKLLEKEHEIAAVEILKFPRESSGLEFPRELRGLEFPGCLDIFYRKKPRWDMRRWKNLKVVWDSEDWDRGKEMVGMKFPPSLRYAKLWHAGRHSVQSICGVKSLRYLELECSAKGLPNSLWKLPELEHLDIHEASYYRIYKRRKTTYLTRLPEILGQQSSALLRLTINDCNLLRKLPESLGQLRALSVLGISCCKSLTELPESLGQLWALSELEISHCASLTELPESLGQLRALSVLKISDCALKELPESLGRLSALSRLSIDWCSNFRKLPESLGQLRALSELVISNCTFVKKVPESIAQLLTLTELKISCQFLESLPESIGQLVSLKHLSIRWCGDTLPAFLGQLRNLEYLEIDNCKITDLGFLSQANALEHLTLRNIGSSSKSALPLSVGESGSGSVSRLTIQECLQSEIAVLPNSLEYLEIRWCDQLRKLPDSLGQLSRLRKLVIQFCPDLRQLPDSLGQLSRLRELVIQLCPDLRQLPDSLGQLSRLREVVIEYCKELGHWRPSAAQVGAELQELRFSVVYELPLSETEIDVYDVTSSVTKSAVYHVTFLRQDLHRLVEEGKSLLEGARQMLGVRAGNCISGPRVLLEDGTVFTKERNGERWCGIWNPHQTSQRR